MEFIYHYEAPVRLSVFLAGFILFALWEWARPRRKLSQLKFRRWLSNFSLIITGTVLVRIVLPTAAVGMAYLVEQEQWGFANHFDLPFWVKVVATFILLDLVIFLQHAMFHVIPVLWRFHRVHHSDLDCDVTTGLRFHPVEILISILFKLLVIIILGAPVLAVILFEVVLNLMSMFTHSNIRLNTTFERVLRWFIVTPDMHRIHHSTRENETNSNFGFHLSFWDRILATYLANPMGGQEGMAIGLEQFNHPDWQDIKGLMLMPFTASIRGYAVNDRDSINTDELLSVKRLVDEQTKDLRQAKETAEQKNKDLCIAMERLTESKDYQQMLVENMVDGFITTDRMGVIESFNSAAESIFSYKADEVIGKNVSILMPESRAKKHDVYMEKYKDKGFDHVIGVGRELIGQRKDGLVFPIDIALNETEIKGKKIFIAVVRDISNRVLAQQQLRAQNEQLANVLGNTCDAYMTVDEDWLVTYVNPVFESLLDFKPEEVVGFDLRETLPDVVSMFYKMLRRTLTTQESQDATVLYGPTMKYLEAHSCPTTEGLMVSFRDITSRRKSEEELWHAREKAFRDKEKVRHAVELASYMQGINQHAIVSVTDPGGRIIDANEKFCEVSGYSKEELLGQNHRLIKSDKHPDSFFTDMWSSISSGKNWQGEICNLTKQGDYYWVDSTIVPLVGENGKIERYISVRLDITEQKRKEEELHQAYHDLAEVNEQLHELNRLDSLTNIANRRHFDETLKNEISRMNRLKLPLTLILCDIDYFKNYNDAYGHHDGDVCLQQVAQAIQSNFKRVGDLVARYGGEEMAIILPGLDKDAAILLAERMRNSVQQLGIAHSASAVAEEITVSVGVTSIIPEKDTRADMFIKNADKALYKAKDEGRNNVQYF